MGKLQVKVVSSGASAVPLIKSLRLIAHLGLGEAKHLSDYLSEHAPCILVAGVDSEVAEHAAGLLREVGAEVVVEESSLDTPMLLCPEANQQYQWNWLAGAVLVTNPT